MVFQSMELLLEREGEMKIRYSNTRIVKVPLIHVCKLHECILWFYSFLKVKMMQHPVSVSDS